MSFALKERDAISVHIRMDNMTALSYLMKMGGTKNQELTAISKEIWQYLLKRKITITPEYLPGSMNVEADRESRQTRDCSEWKLNSTIFMKLCQIRGTPEMDLFASSVSHELPQYMSMVAEGCQTNKIIAPFFHLPFFFLFCFVLVFILLFLSFFKYFFIYFFKTKIKNKNHVCPKTAKMTTC